MKRLQWPKYNNRKQKLNEVYADDLILEINEGVRKKIQKSLLDMFLDVQEVCFRHHIRIYLCGGSALGAIRHKGFIPWDDDIDISMTRSDFMKFQKVFKKELSYQYHLNAPNYSKEAKSRFPKIMKRGTVFRELGDTSPTEDCGLFIDVFIMDNVPNGKIQRAIKGICCNILEYIGSQVGMVESESDEWRIIFKRSGTIVYYSRYLVGKIFSFKPSYFWNDRIDRMIQHGNNKSEYCSLASGSKHYFGEMMKRSDFIPAVPIEFEGHRAYVFHNVDRYLSKQYGDDFMIPHVPEKRQKHFIKELSL